MPSPRRVALSEWGAAVEARLDELGLTKRQIIDELEINASTFYRWLAKPANKSRRELLNQALARLAGLRSHPFPATTGEDREHGMMDRFRAQLGEAVARREKSVPIHDVIYWLNSEEEVHAQLRERERELRVIIEGASEVFSRHAISPDLKVLWISANVRELSGYDPEEFLNQTPLPVVHPDHLPAVAERYERIMATGEPQVGISRIIRKDRQRRWVESTWTLLKDDHGSAKEIMIVTRDVTEQHERAREIERTKERLDHLLNSAPVVVHSATWERPSSESPPAATITYISGNIRDVLGFDPEVCYQPGFWTTNVHRGDLETVIKPSVALIFAEGQVSTEYRFRHADGSYRWIRDEVRITAETESSVDVIGCFRDVTEIVEARREQEWAAAILDEMHVMIGVLDPTGRILRRNRAQRTLFRRADDDAVGRYFWEFMVHEKDRQRTKEQFARGDYPSVIEGDFFAGDGTIFRMNWTVIPILDDGGELKYLVGQGRDITVEAGKKLRAQTTVGSNT
jgi:PAS domain S-box-containing protein